jgi:tetratricopeptide (TPR) repeat protein
VPPGRPVNAYLVTVFLAELSKTLGLYYTQPSYGYFFESFYLKPHQAVYQMVLFTNNAITPPPLTASELSVQDDYWKKTLVPETTSLKKVEEEPKRDKKSPRKAAAVGLEREVQMVYSRALDHFGFEAQRAGDLKRAGVYFDRALQFNPQNLHAFINKDYNLRLQAGRSESLPPSTNVLQRTQEAGLGLDQRLNLYGPPDEPSISEYLAQHFHATMLYRQAGQWLERSLAYEPTNINRRLFLISEALHLGMADHVLLLITELRAHPPVPLTPEDQLDLLRAEAWAHFSKGDLPTAERLLRAARQQFPDKSTPFSTLAEIYQATRGSTNAVPINTILSVYEDQLKLQPNNLSALGNVSWLLINAGDHEKALPYLERALSLKPDDADSLFKRGYCNLHLAQLPSTVDANRVSVALADLLQVSSIAPEKYTAFWGIGECYRLKKNKAQAIIYYRKFIDAAAPDEPDVPLARQRIKVLREGGF